MIWNLGAYGGSTDKDQLSVYNKNHFGRYAWVYIVAPLVAAPVAGILASFHLRAVSDKNGMNLRRASLTLKHS